MSNKPIVSIVMGIYNCASTIEEAVNCIINQTLTEWELIMCDDCSTDNTYETALRIAQKDERIHVLKNEKNLTLAPTLNKCIETAQGKYIARMDGDDVCDLTRLEKELTILETQQDFALVSCFMDMFDDKGVFRTIEHREQPQLKDFLDRSQFCHAGCMMRADVLKELGGYNVSKKYNRVEDYDLWVRMYIAGYKGFNIQESLYSMRDDRAAVRRRTFSNRVNESRVKWKVYKAAHVSVFKIFKVVAPIVKFFVPTFIYKAIHRKKS